MRRPIGLTVPYREVGYQEKSGWVSLTKDEIEVLSYQSEGNTWKAVELAEKKLKEKNDRSNKRVPS